MLGRTLFALIWLIIAAGLLLPMYPVDVETAGVPAADSMLQAAGFVAPGCQDCVVADKGGATCQPGCACGHLLPAAFALVEDTFTLSIRLIIRPRPLELPTEVQPLPPKLPAI